MREFINILLTLQFLKSLTTVIIPQRKATVNGNSRHQSRFQGQETTNNGGSYEITNITLPN